MSRVFFLTASTQSISTESCPRPLTFSKAYRDRLSVVAYDSQVWRADGRTPIDASEYQVMQYRGEEKKYIREWAVDLGLIADPTNYKDFLQRNFFHLHNVRKTDTLRPNHEVIIQDKETGEMFGGPGAREWLGYPKGHPEVKIDREPLGSDYNVFMQSTSNNRKLAPGQWVMVRMTDSIRHAFAKAGLATT